MRIGLTRWNAFPFPPPFFPYNAFFNSCKDKNIPVEHSLSFRNGIVGRKCFTSQLTALPRLVSGCLGINRTYFDSTYKLISLSSCPVLQVQSLYDPIKTRKKKSFLQRTTLPYGQHCILEEI